MGNGWAEGIHPDDRVGCLDVYRTRFDTRLPFEVICRHRRHDGEYRWVMDQGGPRFTPDGQCFGYIRTCADVTDRRRAEEGLGTLPGRLLEAQEAERRRFAQKLHADLQRRTLTDQRSPRRSGRCTGLRSGRSEGRGRASGMGWAGG